MIIVSYVPLKILLYLYRAFKYNDEEKALASNWYKSVNQDNIFAFEYAGEESKPKMTLVKVLPTRQLWLPAEFDSFSLVRILDTYSCTDMCYHSIIFWWFQFYYLE